MANRVANPPKECDLQGTIVAPWLLLLRNESDGHICTDTGSWKFCGDRLLCGDQVEFSAEEATS